MSIEVIGTAARVAASLACLRCRVREASLLCLSNLCWTVKGGGALRFLYVDCLNWKTLGERAKERRDTNPSPEEEDNSSVGADIPPALERATVSGGRGNTPISGDNHYLGRRN